MRTVRAEEQEDGTWIGACPELEIVVHEKSEDDAILAVIDVQKALEECKSEIPNAPTSLPN